VDLVHSCTTGYKLTLFAAFRKVFHLFADPTRLDATGCHSFVEMLFICHTSNKRSTASAPCALVAKHRCCQPGPDRPAGPGTTAVGEDLDQAPLPQRVGLPPRAAAVPGRNIRMAGGLRGGRCEAVVPGTNLMRLSAGKHDCGASVGRHRYVDG
jgi:hypothetical protein